MSHTWGSSPLWIFSALFFHRPSPALVFSSHEVERLRVRGKSRRGRNGLAQRGRMTILELESFEIEDAMAIGAGIGW
jgi:hypothetical protein